MIEPVVTSDDRDVVFVSNRTGSSSLWIVPLEGGEPTEVAKGALSMSIDIAPNGRLLFAVINEGRRTFVVCDTARKRTSSKSSRRSPRG
jgi:Tol biopolymer transport system component